jgi:hypothetical protein
MKINFVCLLQGSDDKTDPDPDGDDVVEVGKVGEKRRISESPPPNSSTGSQPSKKSKSELARFYEATVEGRALRYNNLT